MATASSLTIGYLLGALIGYLAWGRDLRRCRKDLDALRAQVIRLEARAETLVATNVRLEAALADRPPRPPYALLHATLILQHQVMQTLN